MDVRDDRLGTAEEAPAKGVAGRKPRVAPTAVPEASAAHEDQAQYGDQSVTGEDEFQEMSEEELESFFENFQGSLSQSVLPDLPFFPGYHSMWLTTTNPRDSVQARLRMGYRLIRVKECQGWDGVSLKTGEYEGCIGINEMVAARIPLQIYNRIMKHVHHDLPLQDEEKLRANTEAMVQQATRRGLAVDEGDGMAEIVQRAPPMPAFDR